MLKFKPFTRVLLLFLVCFPMESRAIDNQPGNSPLFYSFLLNITPIEFNFPMVGIVNIGSSSALGFHGGVVNLNHEDFTGIQAGGFNTILGLGTGIQAGAVNLTYDSFMGSQAGVINMAMADMNGVQAGLINISKELNGYQIGLINYMETINAGLPLGFVNIIRSGGYTAVELYYSELAPFNIGYKIGMDSFNTSFFLGFDPFSERDLFIGTGMGGLVIIDDVFYFNPEVYVASSLGVDTASIGDYFKSTRQYVSFVGLFGANLNDHFSIFAGPSLAWVWRNDGIKPEMLFGLTIKDDCRLALGARAGLRFRW
jgi:hypothetical protein